MMNHSRTAVAALASDRAFTAQAAESGAQGAFLEYLAADSVLFWPGAVNGREWLLPAPSGSPTN